METIEKGIWKKYLGIAVVLVLVAGLFISFNNKQTSNVEKTTKVSISYLPVVNALPLYLALDKGYFKDAGLDVTATKFDAPNQIIDSLISGSADIGAPGSATGILAISQSKIPNTLKLFALNGAFTPSNIDNILIIKSDSTIKSVKDLKGKILGINPGIQFQTITKDILDNEGISQNDVIITEIALPLQLQALVSKQVDAVLSLEPVRTIGMNKNLVKDLVVGPMNKYINDPWYGGGGIISEKFLESNPDTARKVVAVFDRAIKEIMANPDSARQYLNVHTSLTPDLVTKVPLPVWKMYTDFTTSDISALQKFVDVFIKYAVIKQPLDVNSLIYVAK